MTQKKILTALKQIEEYLSEKDADYVIEEWLPALTWAIELVKESPVT